MSATYDRKVSHILPQMARERRGTQDLPYPVQRRSTNILDLRRAVKTATMRQSIQRQQSSQLSAVATAKSILECLESGMKPRKASEAPTMPMFPSMAMNRFPSGQDFILGREDLQHRLVETPLETGSIERNAWQPSSLGDRYFQQGSFSFRSGDAAGQPSAGRRLSVSKLKSEKYVNGKVSEQIQVIHEQLNKSRVGQRCHQAISKAIWFYYQRREAGNVRSLLWSVNELTTVTRWAQDLDLTELMARAQLWKAVIFHDLHNLVTSTEWNQYLDHEHTLATTTQQLLDEVEMGKILGDSLSLLLMADRADYYQLRKILPLYTGETWEYLQSNGKQDNKAVAGEDYSSWVAKVTSYLEQNLKVPWPNPDVAVKAFEVPIDIHKEITRLCTENEELEGQTSRLRAERDLIGEWNPHLRPLSTAYTSDTFSGVPRFEPDSGRLSVSDNVGYGFSMGSMEDILENIHKQPMRFDNGSWKQEGKHRPATPLRNVLGDAVLTTEQAADRNDDSATYQPSKKSQLSDQQRRPESGPFGDGSHYPRKISPAAYRIPSISPRSQENCNRTLSWRGGNGINRPMPRQFGVRHGGKSILPRRSPGSYWLRQGFAIDKVVTNVGTETVTGKQFNEPQDERQPSEDISPYSQQVPTGTFYSLLPVHEEIRRNTNASQLSAKPAPLKTNAINSRRHSMPESPGTLVGDPSQSPLTDTLSPTRLREINPPVTGHQEVRRQSLTITSIAASTSPSRRASVEGGQKVGQANVLADIALLADSPSVSMSTISTKTSDVTAVNETSPASVPSSSTYNLRSSRSSVSRNKARMSLGVIVVPLMPASKSPPSSAISKPNTVRVPSSGGSTYSSLADAFVGLQASSAPQSNARVRSRPQDETLQAQSAPTAGSHERPRRPSITQEHSEASVTSSVRLKDRWASSLPPLQIDRALTTINDRRPSKVTTPSPLRRSSRLSDDEEEEDAAVGNGHSDAPATENLSSPEEESETESPKHVPALTRPFGPSATADTSFDIQTDTMLQRLLSDEIANFSAAANWRRIKTGHGRRPSHRTQMKKRKLSALKKQLVINTNFTAGRDRKKSVVFL